MKTAGIGLATADGGRPDQAVFTNTLAFRSADLRVKEMPLGAVLLAVAADKIGRTAMRCALLLDALGSVDRSVREGGVAEVYPAASLRARGLPHRGLKGADGLLNRESAQCACPRGR